jgi:hypothetical protein
VLGVNQESYTLKIHTSATTATRDIFIAYEPLSGPFTAYPPIALLNSQFFFLLLLTSEELLQKLIVVHKSQVHRIRYVFSF